MQCGCERCWEEERKAARFALAMGLLSAVAMAALLSLVLFLSGCSPAKCVTPCGVRSDDVECGALSQAEASIVTTYSTALGRTEQQVCDSLVGWEVRVYSPDDVALQREGFTSCPCIDGAACFCPPFSAAGVRGLTDWVQRRILVSERPHSQLFSQMLLSYALPHETMHVQLGAFSSCEGWVKGTVEQDAIDVAENEVQASERLTGATTP